MANQFLSVERGRRWIQQKVTYVVLESQTEISTARILAIVTYKPRCDDETRPSEQIDSFSHVVTPPGGGTEQGWNRFQTAAKAPPISAILLKSL